MEAILNKFAQLTSSFHSFRTSISNRLSGLKSQVEAIDQRLTRIEKQLGVLTPTERKMGQRDPDSRRTNLDAVVKDLNRRIGELEK